jgi:hypothetical protein
MLPLLATAALCLAVTLVTLAIAVVTWATLTQGAQRHCSWRAIAVKACVRREMRESMVSNLAERQMSRVMLGQILTVSSER